MKFDKKIIAIFCAASMVVSNFGYLSICYAEGYNKSILREADVTAPELDLSSIKVNKKEATVGDTVKISLKVSDDISGVNSVNLEYKIPETSNKKSIYAKYNSDTELYEANMYINENTQSGDWKVDYIYLSDKNSNSKIIYNSNTNSYGSIKEDLSSCDFTVIGTKSDTTAPELDLSSIKVNKKEVTVGDTVKISLKVSDDISGVNTVNLEYKIPGTSSKKSIYAKYNLETELYEANMYIDENTQNGDWKVDYVYLSDKNLNSKIIYNSNTSSFGSIKEDLSSLDFTVKPDENPVKPIENVTVVFKNESWSNKTINGDLYIGPEAVLTVNSNVSVNGDIYVLGVMKSYGGLSVSGTIYGRSMSFGSSTLYNGTIVLNGSNSIGSLIMSNYPVADLPIRIDNEPLVANSGNVDLKGATVNVANMYVEGQAVNLDYKGRFDIKDIYIRNKDKVTVEFVTVFGNRITKKIEISDHINPPIETLNSVPTIIANDVEFKAGQAFNPLVGVSANDKEDGNLTNNIQIIKNTVNINKAGTYEVTFKVTDSQGASSTKTIVVTVKSNEKPVITATDKVLKVGDTFNAKTGVSASDKEDGDITSKIVLKESTVNTSEVGTYKVVYEVTDSDGNKVSKEIEVTVRSNEKPVITATDKVLKVGDTFNAKTGVSASDKEDGDITSKIVVKENTVNTSKPGTYKVVYEVSDSDKNTVIKEIKVTVNNVFTNFTVSNIDNKTTIIKGKGISGATVKVYVGTKQIGNTVTVNTSGNYSITIPAQSANTKITVQISKSGYETAKKTISVIGITSGSKKTQTTDIFKYDAGKVNHLTYINGKGYSQFVYLNKSGNYAFTPSSWMTAAGLDVSMPKSTNGYTMTIDNSYIQMYNEANTLLNNIKSGKVAKTNIEAELNKIKDIKTREVEVHSENMSLSKSSPTRTKVNDIFKYDIEKGKYLTYINGKGYSQFVYLNKSGNYAFTPSSWMVAAGLTVTMPSSSNGYTMKINNPYINKYNDTIKQIESYIR